MQGGFIQIQLKNNEDQDTTLYQLRIDSIIWQLGDEKTINTDAVKNRAYKIIKQTPNIFFRRFIRRISVN